MQVYSTQTAFYSIDRLNLGCRYSGAAAGGPPSVSAQHKSRWWSLHRNARKLSCIYTSGKMEWVSGKNTKYCKNEEKRGKRIIRADGPAPENVYVSARW